MQLFLVLVNEGHRAAARSTQLRDLLREPRTALRRWLSRDEAVRLIEADVDRAIARLHAAARPLETLLADTVAPTRLGKREAFTFFRTLLNVAPEKVESSCCYDTHLDYFVSDSAVECHRDHLDIDGRYLKVLTMKEPPGTTFANLLQGLYGVPGEFVACLEWKRLPVDSARRNLHMRRRHFFNKRVSMVNYVTPDTKAEEMLVDDSASATVKQLGDVLTEVEVNGHFLGECSLSIALWGADHRAVRRSAGEATKVLAAHDGVLYDESYNVLNAWLALVPGNRRYNLRRLALLETNCADLSFLFTLDQGERISPHLGQEALAVFETEHQTPYYFNLHVQDVGHTLITGATGAGKSFLVNFLITQVQKYDPLTVIFDLGHSYRKLAALLGGSYLQLGLRQDHVSINPFAAESTPEHLHFLQGFVRVLLEGTEGYRLTDAEDRELFEAITNLYVLESDQRRLFTLASLLPRSLSNRLAKWIEGGRYGALFDHAEDTLAVSRLQVFDLDGMAAYPELLEPLLFYVLHRVSTVVQDPASNGLLKVCVLDEAWRFIQHERLRAYVTEGLKTWRKCNAAMLLATQTVDDFASGDLLRTVVESCPTKLLLANPSFDSDRHAELFQLNDVELALLADLQPRRQVLLKRPHVTKVLNLNVDPRSYWLYTNTPVDNERVNAVFAKYGFEAGLDHLAASA
ncbi:MAG: VirB4 family type IV secretion system protein [Rhodospirillaceae bacterium]